MALISLVSSSGQIVGISLRTGRGGLTPLQALTAIKPIFIASSKALLKMR